ncbi:efflux RND transporter periplasmic adaptor subunit [Synechococcus sp. PCC 7336]|uniref:efflux RND transporter periplasmic adaptor subunit n=1 Tax=Synechococcus sp. PCC 7336 TaxID=195250 RepID=UPI000348A807|nr:efflux RND transporter periplasmic adaptor subunit [Synechococcus sp. PCC 7336]
MTLKQNSWRQWGLLLAAVTLLAACGGPPRGGGPPPTTVGVAPVETATIRDSSIFIASLGASEFTALRPQVSGRITQVSAQLGDRVSAGEPILQIDPARQQAAVDSRTAAIASARAALDSARATFAASQARLDELQAEVELARGRLESNRGLAESGAISRDAFNESDRNLRQAEAAVRSQEQTIRAQQADIAEAERDLEEARADASEQQVVLGNYLVRAPFSGLVGNVAVKPGDYVTPDTTLTTLSQSDSLEVSLNIPLERVAEVEIGTPVELLDGRNGIVGSSEISFISPQADVTTQSVLVKAVFDNQQGLLRTEQLVRTRVIWSERPSLIVPVTAVTWLGGQGFVFLAQPQADGSDGMPSYVATQQPVQLGQLQDNAYEVLSGLTGDEQLVVTGVQKIFNLAPIVPEADTVGELPTDPDRPSS